MLPDLAVTATRAVLGVFHGHLVHLTIRFAQPCQLDEVEKAWRGMRDVALAEQVTLNEVTERDRVFVTRPQLSRDRLTLAATATVDGLRIGGAVTAVRLLAALLTRR